MLSKNTFQEILAMFSVNFGFEVNGDNGKIYKKLVYDSLCDKTNDELFKQKANLVLQKVSLHDWNESYGYRGKPSVADWLDVFVPKKQMVEKTEYYKCKITGATLVRRVLIEVNNQLKLEAK
jgi:hypothetical protein